ncbi:hypothetical protein ACFW5D_34310 [Streptomyces sp. NPDC058770]|uniref:hypothetical protein n=1 Tax=Streptomyces sp. NPDC058770 TaxID=3346631 RepID=UPI003694403A
MPAVPPQATERGDDETVKVDEDQLSFEGADEEEEAAGNDDETDPEPHRDHEP